MSTSGVATIVMFAVAGWLFLGAEPNEHSRHSERKQEVSSQVRTVSSTNGWNDMQICGHSVQTYFYIVMPPRLIDVRNETYTFESEAGHRYDCTLSGGHVLLDWINYTGDSMSSQSTTYVVGADGKLTVTTQEMTVSYSP